jgi:hypothetical protein
MSAHGSSGPQQQDLRHNPGTARALSDAEAYWTLSDEERLSDQLEGVDRLSESDEDTALFRGIINAFLLGAALVLFVCVVVWIARLLM